MNRKVWVALVLGCLLCAAAVASAAEDEDYDEDGAETGAGDEEKDVVVITKDNFEEKVKKAKFALVEFYAPWCGHCQKLKPEYAKAATALQQVDPAIVIAKCDATQDSDLAQQFEVQGYPTIKWFVDGDVAMDYNGPRDADGIVRWVKKKTGPPAATLNDKDGLATAEKEAEVLVLGFFKDFKGAEFEAFNKAAQKAEDIIFVQTKSADVGKAAGLSTPGVTVITNFEGEARHTSALKDKVTEEAITEHVTGEKLPPTVPFNDRNSPKIFGAGIDRQLLLVAKAEDLKPDAKVFKAFRSVAPSFKGKVVFVTVDADGTSKDPVMNFFGLKDEDTPVLVGFFMGGNKKYRLKESITEKTIQAFAEGVSSGTLTPEYKSASEPEEPIEGGVSVVVGKTFEKIVKDEAKDVLLEVYAPWCGHCKSLEPIYKKLAKRFAKVDTVTIAKMDGTENEHPDVDVKGFPTLVFYPAGKDKAPVPFDGGDRSLKALTKFVKKHATHAFELPKKKSKDEDEEKDEL